MRQAIVMRGMRMRMRMRMIMASALTGMGMMLTTTMLTTAVLTTAVLTPIMATLLHTRQAALAMRMAPPQAPAPSPWPH
jgi:hypothetical protein